MRHGNIARTNNTCTRDRLHSRVASRSKLRALRPTPLSENQPPFGTCPAVGVSKESNHPRCIYHVPSCHTEPQSQHYVGLGAVKRTTSPRLQESRRSARHGATTRGVVQNSSGRAELVDREWSIGSCRTCGADNAGVSWPRTSGRLARASVYRKLPIKGLG